MASVRISYLRPGTIGAYCFVLFFSILLAFASDLHTGKPFPRSLLVIIWTGMVLWGGVRPVWTFDLQAGLIDKSISLYGKTIRRRRIRGYRPERAESEVREMYGAFGGEFEEWATVLCLVEEGVSTPIIPYFRAKRARADLQKIRQAVGEKAGKVASR